MAYIKTILPYATSANTMVQLKSIVDFGQNHLLTNFVKTNFPKLISLI